jgi:kanamycin kinase
LARVRDINVTLLDRFADWNPSVAWDSDGVVTVWKLERDDETRFLKVRKIARHHYSLADERDRMLWAHGQIPVPDVLDYGIDDDEEWLLTTALPGQDATTPEHKADPTWIVALLARGLRELHESLDVATCPFDFTNDLAIAHVKRRLDADVFTEPYEHHEEFRHLEPEQMVERLEALRPADEDIVVCHGDYCFPNVLIDAGMIVGYLDLGELGVADRWLDVAVGAWSTTWNLGPGYEDLFYESYGVDPDPDRIEFYRLLYDLAS